MLKKLKKLKKIKPTTLITQMIITLAYPVVRAFTVSHNRLLFFTDLLTIVGMLLLIVGIIYDLVLHGYFDISGYYLRRGFRSFSRHGVELNDKQTINEYLQEAKDRREDSFNYPLFLGIVYVLVSVFIAYVIL